MEMIVNRFKGIMNYSILVTLLDLIVGCILVFCTSFATKVCAVIAGSLILVHGLFYLVKYFYDGLGLKIFRVDLIVGIAAIILGLFTIFNPFSAVSVLGILFGIWLILMACEKFYYVAKFIKVNEEIYPLVGFISILILIMGILCVVNPFESFMIISKLVGIFIICSALFDLMTCMLFKKRALNILKIFM